MTIFGETVKNQSKTYAPAASTGQTGQKNVKKVSFFSDFWPFLAKTVRNLEESPIKFWPKARIVRKWPKITIFDPFLTLFGPSKNDTLPCPTMVKPGGIPVHCRARGVRNGSKKVSIFDPFLTPNDYHSGWVKRSTFTWRAEKKTITASGQKWVPKVSKIDTFFDPF